MPRVELQYPKIPGSRNAPIGGCIAFEKYDGTNLHWAWDCELGWYAFGTRRMQYDFDESGIAEFEANHAECAEAPAIFRSQFADPLEAVFQTNRYCEAEQIKVFTEFLGEQSFAGKHLANDPKELVLLDVSVNGELVDPDSFVRDFATLNIARVVYRGRLTGKFIHDVREGKFNVGEGVVCKSTGDEPWMIKVKTDAYMARLKAAFHDDWESFWE